MHTVSTPFAANNPHTTSSWCVGLPDDPHAEMLQASLDRLQILNDRQEQLDDLARIAAEDAQQLADIDSDFCDYIGPKALHNLIDAFTSHDTRTLKRELSRLMMERSKYRAAFIPAH